MQEKVVRLRASSCPDRDVVKEQGDDPAMDYVIDMVGQLARIARDHGEPVLGAMLEEVLQRRGALRPGGRTARSHGKSPG